MKPYNYYTVFPYLAHLLGISGVEKDIFFSIFYFLTYKDDGVYYYNSEQLTYNALCSEKQARRALNNLVKKGILAKEVSQEGIKRIVAYSLTPLVVNLSRNSMFEEDEKEVNPRAVKMSVSCGQNVRLVRSKCPSIYKDKNNYIKNNYTHTLSAREEELIERETNFHSELSASQIKKEQILMATQIPIERYDELLPQFYHLNIAKGNRHENLQDYTSHFIEWLKYQNNRYGQERNIIKPSHTDRATAVRNETLRAFELIDQLEDE